MLKSINQFIGLFVESFKLFGQVKAWMFLLVIFIVDGILLLAHYQFYSPVFYTIITWWTQTLNDQYAAGFTHYPGHFILFPYYYNIAKLIVGLFIEGALLGGTAVVFYRYFFNLTDPDKRIFGSTIHAWIQLSLGWVFINGILTAAHLYLPDLLRSFLHQSPRRQLVFDYGVMPAIDIVVVALCFFIIPYIAIYRTNIFSALLSSIKIFFKHPFFCLFLSVSILILPLIFAAILNHPNIIVEKFKPEMVYWLLFAALGADVFVNFFWMSTAVGFMADFDE